VKRAFGLLRVTLPAKEAGSEKKEAERDSCVLSLGQTKRYLREGGSLKQTPALGQRSRKHHKETASNVSCGKIFHPKIKDM